MGIVATHTIINEYISAPECNHQTINCQIMLSECQNIDPLNILNYIWLLLCVYRQSARSGGREREGRLMKLVVIEFAPAPWF